MRRAALALVATLAIVTAGCRSEAPSASIAAATPTTAPPTAAPTQPPTASPASTPGTSAPAGGTVEDPTLLEVLPADVDGIPVNLEHQAFVEATADEAFAQHVRRAAFGVAVEGSDLASGVVAELQPGTFSDAFFRDWRDTYNAGACGQAGGVAGSAEADIDGRTVYITTCGGGLRTYHVWVPERGAIVSAFALGERRLGELLMEGLRP